jgi:hypothetical protein
MRLLTYLPRACAFCDQRNLVKMESLCMTHMVFGCIAYIFHYLVSPRSTGGKHLTAYWLEPIGIQACPQKDDYMQSQQAAGIHVHG